MNIDNYQKLAQNTAIYKKSMGLVYCTLGLTGEAGEVSDKVKKILRDRDGKFTKKDLQGIAKELGDVLWYVANLSNEIGYSLSEVAQMNIDKLSSRQNRGALGGSGDDR